MTNAEIIQRLREVPNRAEVARRTNLRPMYLARVAWGLIKNPGATQMDTLREYFEKQDGPLQ